MATLTNPKNISVSHSFTVDNSRVTTSGFTKWCAGLEDFRYPLLSAIVIIQGCLVIPFTLLLSLYVNIGLTEFTVAAVAATTMGVMVTNMALSSMKVIVVMFALNLLINLSLILVHLIALI